MIQLCPCYDTTLSTISYNSVHDMIQHCPQYDTTLSMIWYNTVHNMIQLCPWYDTTLSTIWYNSVHNMIQHCPQYDTTLSMIWYNTVHNIIQLCPWYDTTLSTIWYNSVHDMIQHCLSSARTRHDTIEYCSWYDQKPFGLLLDKHFHSDWCTLCSYVFMISIIIMSLLKANIYLFLPTSNKWSNFHKIKPRFPFYFQAYLPLTLKSVRFSMEPCLWRAM